MADDARRGRRRHLRRAALDRAVPRERARHRDGRRRQRLDRRHRRVRPRALSRRARRRAGEPRPRAPAGTAGIGRPTAALRPDPERRRLARPRARSSGWSPFADRQPRRRRRRAAAAQPRRHAAAVGARLPDASGGSRPSTSSCASSRRARALSTRSTRAGFDHDERARGGVRDGRVHARAARGDRRGRAARRGVLPLQRGDRLVLPLRARRGWKVVFIPGRRMRPRRRRRARRPPVPRERARAPPLLSPSTAACARPSARGGCCARRCRRPRRVCSAASAGGCTARPRPGSAPATCRRCSSDLMLLLVRLVFGDRRRARARRDRRAGARRPRRRRRRSLGRWRSSSRALGVTFVASASLGADPRAAPRRRGGRRSASRRRGAAARALPGAAGSSPPGRCSACSSGTSPATIGGDGFFHLARVQQAPRVRRPLAARASTSSRTAGSIPATRSRSGTASSRSSRRSPASTRSRSCCTADRARAACRRASPTRRVGRSSGASSGRGVGRPQASRSCAMAPAHGGAFTALALPATASRQLLLPAALALAVEATRDARPGRSSPRPPQPRSCSPSSIRRTRCSSGSRSRASSPSAGSATPRRPLRARSRSVRSSSRRRRSSRWLLPVVRDTASVEPGPGRADARVGAVRRAARVVRRPVLGSRRSSSAATGAVAVAGAPARPARRPRRATPLGSLRRRRLHSRSSRLLVPWIFTPFSDAVSLSQSRRLAGFLPLAFAFAGGIGVLARLLGALVVPVALVAGIALQLALPGGLRLHAGVGRPGARDVVRGRRRARRTRARLPAARAAGAAAPRLAAALFLLPTYVHGLAHWTPSDGATAQPAHGGARRGRPRRRFRSGRVVYSDPETSYRLGAVAPVYICVAPPGHVADTVATAHGSESRSSAGSRRPATSRSRARAARLARGRPKALRASRAAVAPAYRDARWALYRLG